jgi:hypothetical protein
MTNGKLQRTREKSSADFHQLPNLPIKEKFLLNALSVVSQPISELPTDRWAVSVPHRTVSQKHEALRLCAASVIVRIRGRFNSCQQAFTRRITIKLPLLCWVKSTVGQKSTRSILKVENRFHHLRKSPAALAYL